MSTETIPTTQVTLSRDVHFGNVPWVSGGDAEVNTKRGRSTIVEVTTRNIQNLGTHVAIDLTYTVKEVWHDHTTLSRTDRVTIQAPVGMRILSAGEGRSHCNFSRAYPDKDHNWHDATGNVGGSFLAALMFRFDGGGRDDRGNAQMRARVEIPVTLAD